MTHNATTNLLVHFHIDIDMRSRFDQLQTYLIFATRFRIRSHFVPKLFENSAFCCLINDNNLHADDAN